MIDPSAWRELITKLSTSTDRQARCEYAKRIDYLSTEAGGRENIARNIQIKQ